MKVSICIPMYNESKIIASKAQELSAFMANNFENYEILFCNDGSTDHCDKIVESLNLPRVKVIGHEQNKGKGAAVKCAMLEAQGDIRIFTDSDLAYGTDVIKQVVEYFKTDKADVVIGSRVLHKEGYANYSAMRKIASKIYIKVLNLIGGFQLSDSQCGFKAYRGYAAERIFRHCCVEGFAFDYETILLARKFQYSIKEMPIKIINHGESKVNIIKDTLKMLNDIIKVKKKIKRMSPDD